MDPRQPQPLHVGRRVFVGAVLAGVAGLAINLRKLPGFHFIASTFTVNGFYIYTTGGIPRLTEKNYRLTVGGMVKTPLTFTLDDIRAMPRTRVVRDFHCVTGWTVPKVAWTGVKMSDFLTAVNPHPRAKYVLMASADGEYTESLDMQQANLSNVLLGYALNDKPLSAEQGYPLRLVIPDMYGFKYIKWVNRITLNTNRVPGYWEQRGYAIDAWLGSRSNYGRATSGLGWR
ncbi:MAG: yedY 2 [Chloroflexi bacterium]|nr:yedY 2 [Chloroflexota bacterium]